MSKTVSWSITDTPIPDVTSLNFARGLTNFKEDFSMKNSTPGECVLANLTSPLDRVETVTVASSTVSNVYNNTGIDPKVQSPSKRGTQVLVKIQDTLTVTDDTDPAYRIDLPIQSHIVMRFPNDENVTSDVMLTQVGRLVSCMYDTGSTTSNRLNEIMRGSVLSSEV